MSEKELLLTTHQAAYLLDAHPSSIKRWCNEGTLSSSKTEGGHRRIRLQDLLAFAREHEPSCHLLQLHPHEQDVWRGLLAVREEQDYGALHALLTDWLEAHEARRPHHLLHLLHASGAGHGEVFEELLLRALDGLYRRDARGELHDGEIARARQVVLRALERFGAKLERERRAAEHAAEGDSGDASAQAPRCAVVGGAPASAHEVPALMARFLIEQEGWKVVYLGPRVRAEAFARQQERFGAALICVAFTGDHSGGATHQTLRLLRQLYVEERPYRLGLYAPAAAEANPGVGQDEKPFEALHLTGSMHKLHQWLH